MEDYVDKLRELSRVAFGQKYRLECMLAVADAEDGLVTLTTLARTLDVTASNIQVSLKSLLATGLIAPLESGDSRSKFYVRNASGAWDWCRELASRARESAMFDVSRTQHT